MSKHEIKKNYEVPLHFDDNILSEKQIREQVLLNRYIPLINGHL